MNYAIIAAGEGQRLKDEGILTSKPLIRINGIPLIERLINIFLRHDAESISCIINSESVDLKKYLDNLEIPVPFNLIVKSTPSSLHSLYELRVFFTGKPFMLTTTDSIFPENDFKKYLSAIQTHSNDGVLAITDFIDDEKPLYVELDENNRIKEFSDNKTISNCVTGGIYYFNKNIFSAAENILNSNVHRLRNLLKYLVQNGFNISAFMFPKIIDVDHVTDIQKAEELIMSEKK
jgi:NDP-sugar pyrophosphorylase family protein